MGRYTTSSDIFNAPEVGLSLTTRFYLTPFTRHLPATTTFLLYTSNNNGSGNHKTPLYFAIPLYIRAIIKDQTLLRQTPIQES